MATHTPAPKKSTISDLRKLDAQGVKLTAAERKQLREANK